MPGLNFIDNCIRLLYDLVSNTSELFRAKNKPTVESELAGANKRY
jgi:hypothetical protein